jgi:hypothetical protein
MTKKKFDISNLFNLAQQTYATAMAEKVAEIEENKEE